MAELNPFKIAQEQLDAAAERLGLDPATHELLRREQPLGLHPVLIHHLQVLLQPVQNGSGKRSQDEYLHGFDSAMGL